MKKNNNPRGRRVEDSQQPFRKNKPAKPVEDFRKPRKKSFAKEEGVESTGNFPKKSGFSRSRATKSAEVGERPSFKGRETNATGDKTYKKKAAFSNKSEEKSFHQIPRGKGDATRKTFIKRDRDKEDFERKPFSAKGNKPSSDRRESNEFKERKPRTSTYRSYDKEGSEPKKRFFKDTSETKSRVSKKTTTEERPQNRTQRSGYYSDKRRSTESTKPTPEYNLKKFEEKHKRGIQKDTETETTRLNRYISNAGICSRREADKLIESGEIKVNGKVITEMGFQVGKNDIVKYGNRVLNKEKMVYVLLNKPKGYITTTEDPEERKTVMDLVSNACEQRIYPVGRLDRNTSGLLLFTNDGELAEKLAHPSNEIKKIYQVELNKPITKVDFEKVLEGVQLEDGLAKVDELAVISPDNTLLGLEIHIGRNRIVRRIFEHLGYEVVKLDRVSYAGLTKKDLPRGNWRFLTEKEVIKLKYFI